MLLTLGVGNAWAETIVLKASDGFQSSYQSSDQTFTKSEITFGYLRTMYNANGTPTGWYKQQLMQLSKNASSTVGGDIWNVTSVNIAKITVKLAVNNNDFTLFYGTSAKPSTNSIAKSDASSSTETITYSGYSNKTEQPGQTITINVFTFDLSGKGATHFLIDNGSKANYIWEIVIETSSATPDPVDPTVTFSDGSYTVGDAALDLSSLWTSTSTGEVTYKVANAGTTGASISGKSFTATAAGTCTVKASQAATSAYNAIEKTATITITAPTPATITLSEAGQEKTVEGKYVGDSYELPLTSTQTCGTKTFVGWSTKEIATPGDKPTSNFYEPGATVTLSAEQTFYAVYATEGEGAAEPEEVKWSYDFSSFSGTSVQYKEETHDLGGGVTINIKDCYINDQLRIYSSDANNGYVISNKLPGTIKSMEFNAGYKVDALVVYGSTDGSTWNQVGKVSVTSASYKDYTLSFVATNYTYFKLDVEGTQQIRVAKMSITYMSEGGVTTTYSDYTTSCEAAPAPAVLVSIAANEEGKNEFTEGDEFIKAIITATYNDATTKDVTEDATFTGYDMNTTGTQTVTVTYEGQTTTYQITVNAKTPATLTLSKNGVEEAFEGEHKVGDVVTLPSITSDCVKQFVGWSTEKIEEPLQEKPTSNFYEPGAEYTLAAETQTLYAVYADVVEGASVNMFSETFDTCEGKGGNDGQWSGSIASGTLSLTDWELIKGSPADGCAKFGTGSVKGSAETPAIALTGNATLTFRSGAWNGSSEKTTLNLSATGATIGQTSVVLKKAEWTEYTIYITEATGSVKIKFEASADEDNRFFLDDVVVSQASVTYSNYSTTCTAALDAPTFTPVAGTYNEVTNVTISATDGDVYYTLDGTTPTEESNKYTAPIVLNTNGTTTIKAIAISGESQSSVVTATYTIKLPLTTMDEIFAVATIAGGAEAPVLIKMNNWVVTGVSTKNAYVTDGTKGFVIYKEEHGFNVGDILSGTVACNVQLFKGSAELTELTATTEGLTITTGGTVSTVVVDDVTTLSGVNTGSVIKINGVHESDNIVNNVKLYNTLFSFENLTPGQEYNVTGVYLQYDPVKEILPRSAADIEEVAGLPTATISIENITLVEGDEHTIVATITPDEAASKVTYSIKNGDEYISLSGNVITANAVGTATITAAIAEVDGVYHGTTKDFTVTVKEYVAPISGTWKLVTDASTLKAGMEVIVAQYVEEDGTIYTMGAQKTNNRDVVESSVSGTTLTPTTGTSVLTLVDAGNGTFALQVGNGKYLYAASSSANHLKEKDKIDENGQWTITIADSKATIKAEGSSNRNWIRYNNSSTMFSCYASGQKDIALYAKKPAESRTTSAGRYGTVCLPGNIVKCLGATLYEVAGKDGNKVIFDEVLTPEAGMPYIFLAHNAEVLFYCGDQTAAAGNHNSLYGTFTVLQNSELEGMYMVQNNKIVECNPANSGVAAYRAYFNGDELKALGSAPAPMPGRKRITMGTESENTTTGTEDIVAPEGQTLKLIENGQLIIIRNGEKFNAQGIKL